MYFEVNTLYKDTAENIYILGDDSVEEHTRKDFSRLCNMLSEYGTLEKTSGATIAFLGEHCKVLLENDAVQQLANV
ncbi:MAG: adaptor protein MecA [Dorea sp.]